MAGEQNVGTIYVEIDAEVARFYRVVNKPMQPLAILDHRQLILRANLKPLILR
jgi:hypothetical protein